MGVSGVFCFQGISMVFSVFSAGKRMTVAGYFIGGLK